MHAVAMEAESPRSNDAHHVGHVKKEHVQPPVLVGITVYKRRREEVELTLSCQCATAPLHTPRNVFKQTLCESWSSLDKSKELYP
jgi:hypothetical protein